MEFVLSQNVFIFDSVVYRQRHGTAMGTKFAPSFANIYMADLEKTFLQDYPVQPSLWLRYIDDIIMLWDHSLLELSNFLHSLNNFDQDKIYVQCIPRPIKKMYRTFSIPPSPFERF